MAVRALNPGTILLRKRGGFRSVHTIDLSKIPEIVECVNISGEYAFHTKIFALSNKHLRDIIYDKIQNIKGIETTNTIIAFETTFERKVPLTMEWSE